MDDATKTTVTPYETYNPTTKLIIHIEKEVQIADAANTPFTNAHIIDNYFRRLDYTVKNEKHGINVLQHKKYVLTSASTSINHTRI